MRLPPGLHSFKEWKLIWTRSHSVVKYGIVLSKVWGSELLTQQRCMLFP